ncbi:MAG: hypothetical protein ACK5PU_04085 [bacterium]|jgi:hypothetical protein
MSGSADQRLSIRLSFEGAQEARAQLEQLGQAGDTAMRRLETGGQAASRGVAAVGQAGNALRAGLGQVNGDLAATQRQFESLANSTVQLAGALRGGAGLAGTIGIVATAAFAAYEIFKNWDSITKAFSDTFDKLTGRYRDNSAELDKANGLLKEYSQLMETAAQKTARLAGEAIFARQAQVALSQETLRGEITSIQGEIDRRIGLTEGRISAARRGPGGAALSPDSEEILQREIARTRERAESSPEIQRLRAEMARREEVIARLERERQQIAGQYVASQENVGSVLNQPEATRATREARSARAELSEAEREYQRLVQSGISLAGNAATEQQRYAEQVIALDAALGAARITQEQYNRAVAALDPAARAAREAQEQAARQAEQFARRSRDALAQIGENALDRIGTGLVNAFVMGGKAALDFQSLTKAVIASIAADLLKLAVVTPITNAAFGTSRPTIYGAFQPGGVQGGAGGGGISPSQAMQAAQSLSGGGGGGGGFMEMLGLGGGGGGGGIMSALGLGGVGAGVSSFLAQPVFGAAAQASATNSALAAMPGGMMGPATPAAVGMPGMSIGAVAGSAAAGFGAGMLGGTISGSIRGTADPTAGSAIGAAIGTAIGFALIPVLGPLGPIIGGFVGGTSGGLFGPTKKGMAARSGGDVFLGTDEAGLLTITSARGKRWDQAGATAEVQAQLDAINAQTSARGLTFAGPGQSAIGFGQASGSPRELSLTSLVGQLRSGNANQMTAFGTLAGRGAGLEEALSAADFVVQVFEPLGRAVEKTSAFKSAMEQLTKAYDDAITRARDLGLSESALAAQRAERVAKLEADRARDLDIIDRTIAARRMALGGDNRGAGLTQFDLRAEAELRAFRDQLFQYGLEETGDEYRRRVVALEQTIADERLAVMREFDGQAEALAAQMRGIARGLLENLTVGDLGGLPLEARYGAALASLSAAQRPLMDGASPEELSEFARVAQIALPIAKEFLGVSGSFAELVADVSRTLRTAAPGSDPANLGALLEAQVAGSDRLELAVISTGNMQTEVLRNLLTELRRLTAQNEALLARVSV